MKLVVISDTHARHRTFQALPMADAIIHAGDFSHFGGTSGLEDFFHWFGELPYSHKLLVAGNHDFLAAENPSLFRSWLPEGVHYLEDEGIQIEGIQFWGSPVQPDLVGMAFGKAWGEGMNAHWDLIPPEVDVLITHTPPWGTLDISRSGRHLGCEQLRYQLERVQPRLHVFGHVHASYGQAQLGGIHFVNATSIQNHSSSFNPPILLEI